MQWASHHRIILVAGLVYLADQLTKLLVVRTLPFGEQYVVVEGFFRFVHWGNTGAAWSMFYGNNALLALISVLSLVVLWISRQHFDAGRLLGQVGLGLVFGGILGNLTDRLVWKHVVDFLRFDIYRRGYGEIGFPAFNVADTAICTGVGLLLLAAWQNEAKAAEQAGKKV